MTVGIYHNIDLDEPKHTCGECAYLTNKPLSYDAENYFKCSINNGVESCNFFKKTEKACEKFVSIERKKCGNCVHLDLSNKSYYEDTNDLYYCKINCTYHPKDYHMDNKNATCNDFLLKEKPTYDCNKCIHGCKRITEEKSTCNFYFTARCKKFCKHAKPNDGEKIGGYITCSKNLHPNIEGYCFVLEPKADYRCKNCVRATPTDPFFDGVGSKFPQILCDKNDVQHHEDDNSNGWCLDFEPRPKAFEHREKLTNTHKCGDCKHLKIDENYTDEDDGTIYCRCPENEHNKRETKVYRSVEFIDEECKLFVPKEIKEEKIYTRVCCGNCGFFDVTDQNPAVLASCMCKSDGLYHDHNYHCELYYSEKTGTPIKSKKTQKEFTIAETCGSNAFTPTDISKIEIDYEKKRRELINQREQELQKLAILNDRYSDLFPYDIYGEKDRRVTIKRKTRKDFHRHHPLLEKILFYIDWVRNGRDFTPYTYSNQQIYDLPAYEYDIIKNILWTFKNSYLYNKELEKKEHEENEKMRQKEEAKTQYEQMILQKKPSKKKKSKMYCINCLTKMRKGTVYCPSCGKKIINI